MDDDELVILLDAAFSCLTVCFERSTVSSCAASTGTMGSAPRSSAACSALTRARMASRSGEHMR